MQLNLYDDDEIYKKAIYCPAHKLDNFFQNNGNNEEYSKVQDDNFPSPVHIDKERMDKALSSPTYTLPNGLSLEEIIEYFKKVAKENSK